MRWDVTIRGRVVEVRNVAPEHVCELGRKMWLHGYTWFSYTRTRREGVCRCFIKFARADLNT